ncbi:MAG: 30S ribosomal protein S4 [Candidatus Shapirobacteria bacterium]|nr:30S ribosomal protein S4 [Candidatus Shapirobacteria bacterium]
MQKLQNKKCRICRRLGVKLFLKGKRCYEKCPIDRSGAIPPGVHGRKFSRPTFYSEQLKEKQRLKAIYGLNEVQLKNYFDKARNVEGEPTDEILLQLLELRLDNILYRLGFSSNRRTARQLIVHGKVLVDGHKVTIPSYRVNLGQVVSLTNQAQNIPQIKQVLEETVAVPGWLEKKALAGTIKHWPKKEDIEVEANVSTVIEFYSR